jgi:ribose 5-phosphate isomerase A
VQSDDKRLAARAAADEVRAGMTVGLGTGSTVAELIPILAARIRSGLKIAAVATSEATATAARAAGIDISPFEDQATIDLTIDGVDEIDPLLRAIKGGGGALLREKIVAAASLRMVAIADGTKSLPKIGTQPVPIEILPFARTFVLDAVQALGGRPTLRLLEGTPARSDQDNLLADCMFANLADPAETAAALARIPGLLGHGLFMTEIDALYLADAGKVTRYERGGDCRELASADSPGDARQIVAGS